MADSGSGIGQISEEVSKTASEVAKDVKDSVGQALEQGVQSVIGTQLTPQQIQQKQQEEQQKLVEVRRRIKWFQNLETAQKKVRQDEKQRLLQKEQQEEQEKQTKKMAEVQRKRSVPQPGKMKSGMVREDIARTRQEIGKGHGVGG